MKTGQGIALEIVLDCAGVQQKYWQEVQEIALEIMLDCAETADEG